MVEFDETFSRKIVEPDALRYRAIYRLIPREGRIPYFQGGRRFSSFSQTPSSDILSDCRRLLSDIDSSIGISGDRLLVGDVSINLTEEVI